MNFLQLVQQVFDESAIQGNSPTALASVSGINKRLKSWTAEAWRKIQVSRPNWRWMRASASAQTVIGQRSYVPATEFALTRFARWAPDTFRCYETAVGVSDEQHLFYMPYDDFRDLYEFGTVASGRPVYFTIDPQNTIHLGPLPDKVYTVSADYFKSYQTLSVDGDVPEMPADFHMAIVFRALMRYATFDAAPEVYDDAKNDFDAEIARIEKDQLDPVRTHEVTLVE